MSNLLVIIGATGNQGGSVIKSILADPNATKQFKLRGVTRDISKPAAKALVDQGVEMVAADLDDKASLVKAFEGAYGVFAVTDFWATMDKDTEVKQGRNMADAAKENNVQHYVCSSLINTTETTNGKLSKIDHFVGKAEIGQYAKSLGLPTTLFMAGFYNSNLPGQGIIKTPNGYIVPSPSEADSQWPMFDAANDTGKFVKAIFLNKDKTIGKDIYGAEKYYTPVEVAKAFEEAFPQDGKGTQYVPVKGEDYLNTLKGFGMSDKIAEEMLENMYLLNKEYGYYAGAKLDESLSILSEPPTTLVEFLKKQPAYADLK